MSEADAKRMAALADPFDPDRSDLEPYLAMVGEFGASSVLDVGCGTGTLACQLAERGIRVVGVDPDGSAVDIARTKPGGDSVRWVVGDATTLPPLQVDVAFMTANVAQVFITDDEWMATLAAIHRSLKPGGRLVFETRDPTKEAWRAWTRESTLESIDVTGVGTVQTWCDLLEANAALVSFRWTTVFASDGVVIEADTTLRFRGRDEIERQLAHAGYVVGDVRDAADRPGREFVFVCSIPTER